MEFENFYESIKQKLEKINIEINEEQAKKLYNYMNLMLEWNEKINLTAIIEPEDIILKHFVDSLTILKYLKNEEKVIDVGTGAGFPGIPLNILKQDCNYTLVDSLNKRILFIEEVIKNIELKNIKAIHARIEELGKNKEYREKYNIATSRAVANMRVLMEYLLPFVKIGGKCICMKGPNIKEEIEESKKVVEILGGKILNIEKIILPESNIERNIIIVEKIKQTPLKYPRKAGMPSKEPL